MPEIPFYKINVILSSQLNTFASKAISLSSFNLVDSSSTFRSQLARPFSGEAILVDSFHIPLLSNTCRSFHWPCLVLWYTDVIACLPLSPSGRYVEAITSWRADSVLFILNTQHLGWCFVHNREIFIEWINEIPLTSHWHSWWEFWFSHHIISSAYDLHIAYTFKYIFSLSTLGFSKSLPGLPLLSLCISCCGPKGVTGSCLIPPPASPLCTFAYLLLPPRMPCQCQTHPSSSFHCHLL